MIRLTKTEEEILSLLWKENRPLTRAEIIDLTPDRKWNPASVHAFLNGLLNKGLIRVAGFERTGKRYGRTYCAALTQQELLAKQLCVQQQPTDYPAVFAALIKDADIDEDTLTQLEELLQAKRRELLEK